MNRVLDSFTVSQACANLNAVMDKVVADCAPVVIRRQRGESVVMVSESEWNSIAEIVGSTCTPTKAA